jgi:hypothetical protein
MKRELTPQFHMILLVIFNQRLNSKSFHSYIKVKGVELKASYGKNLQRLS